MADPYVGEIRQFAGTFAPNGWALCNGATVAIADYEVLFNLIGTTYGGDGQSNFVLPNLLGRIPIHQGSGYVMGQVGGSETVTLSTNQIAAHTHVPASSSSGGGNSPAGNVWGTSAAGIPYENAPGNVNMNPATVSVTGGNQPHDNMHPFVAINFIISLYGVYPSQS